MGRCDLRNVSLAGVASPIERIKIGRENGGHLCPNHSVDAFFMRNPIEPRFIIDTNVGHLVRKLRMLGYDTLFINPIEDADLVQRADQEGRVIISGDRRLFERKPIRSGKVKGFLIDTYQDHTKQLQQILRSFGLRRGASFIRCLECNTLLIPKSKEGANGKVPLYVYKTVAQYSYCPRCDQFFWEGGHVKRMRVLIETLEEGPEPTT